MLSPKRENNGDFFKVDLTKIINEHHPLVRLSDSIKWEELEESIKDKYTENTGSPGKSLRLMLGLEYLKYLYDESDEQIVIKYVENPYYQYFCGNQHFEHHLPIDPSSMTRFRKRIGKDKIELLLKGTIESAKNNSLLNPKDYRQLNVDTTVQYQRHPYGREEYYISYGFQAVLCDDTKIRQTSKRGRDKFTTKF